MADLPLIEFNADENQTPTNNVTYCIKLFSSVLKHYLSHHSGLTVINKNWRCSMYLEFSKALKFGEMFG